MRMRLICATMAGALLSSAAAAQTNPLWHEEKIKNYLPHMTWPEVRELLTRTDMALIPVPALEQHGPQTPIGTDYFAGVERSKLIAQRTDVLVVPVLMAGQSPYHMDFPGTITLSPETMQRVYFETAQSLIHHGFRRILLYYSHAGNQYLTRSVADRINQETQAVAITLNDGIAAMFNPAQPGSAPSAPSSFDRHAGVGETSDALYLFPSLAQPDKAAQPKLTYPPHLAEMVPQVNARDPAATLVFLAEALKAKETGKKTSTAEISSIGVWSERNPAEATADQGRRATEAVVDAAVRFIERWKQLRPQQSP
jgi:creatinine amidohydrolase